MTDETQETVSPDPAAGGSPSKEARTMAMLAHLLGILTGFLGPLIIWLIKKDDDPFIDDQGKEALNFQITIAIAMFISGLLMFLCVGFFTAAAVAIADLILCIMAGIKANDGVAYRYPLTLRLIK
jgi:uncharacterized protein